MEETQVDEEDHNDVSNRGGDGPLDFVANNLINLANPFALDAFNGSNLLRNVSISPASNLTQETFEQTFHTLSNMKQDHGQGIFEATDFRGHGRSGRD